MAASDANGNDSGNGGNSTLHQGNSRSRAITTGGAIYRLMLATTSPQQQRARLLLLWSSSSSSFTWLHSTPLGFTGSSPNFALRSVSIRPLTTTGLVLKERKKMADEVTAAQSAGPQEETIFGKMLTGKIPAKFIYEDDQCVAFDDINPTAKVHFLVIPRKTISQLSTAGSEDEQLLGHLMLVADKVAKQKGLGPDGYRVVINNGRHGCQSVYHLHLHVIGGQQLGWPPGTQ